MSKKLSEIYESEDSLWGVHIYNIINIYVNTLIILVTIFLQIFVTSGKRIKNKECSINKTYWGSTICKVPT